ncbi:MAG: ATP-binding protein [Anaerolineae bacterium]|nr:ATP-binding protein [Anaerolineae bacterium]
MTNDRQITKIAQLENLPLIRTFVKECCETTNLDSNIAYDLVLAVDEICTNIATHGYKGLEPGPITVGFKAREDRVTITISDRGHPFDPGNAPEPNLDQDWRKRPVGGLGLFLVNKIANKVSYESSPDGTNHLTLVKKLPTSS